MLPVYFIGLLFVMLILTKLNQAFWDARVRHLCATEGGVTVYETVDLSEPEYAVIPISPIVGPVLPLESNRQLGDPLYLSSQSIVKEKLGGVELVEYQQNIVRSSDHTILGTRVSFSRRGGDFVTFGSPPSSFSCNQVTNPSPDLTEQTLLLRGNQ